MIARTRVENADTVSLVCALLVRFPELASIRSMPADRTVRLTFALRQRLDRSLQTSVTEAIEDHIRSFLSLFREEPETLPVRVGRRPLDDLRAHHARSRKLHEGRAGAAGSVLRRALPRRAGTKSAARRSHRCGTGGAGRSGACTRSRALRDPAQSKSLVGFREEKRVLVYFLKAQKKAKASARR